MEDVDPEFETHAQAKSCLNAKTMQRAVTVYAKPLWWPVAARGGPCWAGGREGR